MIENCYNFDRIALNLFFYLSILLHYGVELEDLSGKA